jgi:hypothetical protein
MVLRVTHRFFYKVVGVLYLQFGDVLRGGVSVLVIHLLWVVFFYYTIATLILFLYE